MAAEAGGRRRWRRRLRRARASRARARGAAARRLWRRGCTAPRGLRASGWPRESLLRRRRRVGAVDGAVEQVDAQRGLRVRLDGFQKREWVARRGTSGSGFTCRLRPTTSRSMAIAMLRDMLSRLNKLQWLRQRRQGRAPPEHGAKLHAFDQRPSRSTPRVARQRRRDAPERPRRRGAAAAAKTRRSLGDVGCGRRGLAWRTTARAGVAPRALGSRPPPAAEADAAIVPPLRSGRPTTRPRRHRRRLLLRGRALLAALRRGRRRRRSRRVHRGARAPDAFVTTSSRRTPEVLLARPASPHSPVARAYALFCRVGRALAPVRRRVCRAAAAARSPSSPSLAAASSAVVPGTLPVAAVAAPVPVPVPVVAAAAVALRLRFVVPRYQRSAVKGRRTGIHWSTARVSCSRSRRTALQRSAASGSTV